LSTENLYSQNINLAAPWTLPPWAAAPLSSSLS